MSENTISSEIYNVICEAHGCYAKATIQMAVKVGQKGSITLQLCRNCVNKFTDG